MEAGLKIQVSGAQAQGPGQVSQGVAGAAKLDLGARYAAAGLDLCVPIAEALRGLQGSVLGSGPVMPVAAAVEEGLQHQGKLPGMGIESTLSGEADGREQHAVLGV